MKVFLTDIEKMLYMLQRVNYPDIWLLASKITQKQLDMVVDNCSNVVVEYDIKKSFSGGKFLQYPFDIMDGNIGFTFFDGKFFPRKKEQLIITNIAVEAPYPYIIRKQPVQNLTTLLQKTTFGIYGVKFSNTLNYLFSKDLHYSTNSTNNAVILRKTSVIRYNDTDLQHRALRNLETLMNIRLQNFNNSSIVAL